uniref:Pseudomytilin 2 n=1 Tax=Mytilus galloprovincialis TaxID=29158 RepID=A0A6B9XNG4_MYTGA|nr:pseudomytilin 2 [Mytilus galloprovincialis]
MKTAIIHVILVISLYVLFAVQEADASCRTRCRLKCFGRGCGAYFAAQRGPFCLCKCYRCANESVTKIDIKQIKKQSTMSHQQKDNLAEEQAQFIQ